jgi:hypothetical protein
MRRTWENDEIFWKENVAFCNSLDGVHVVNLQKGTSIHWSTCPYVSSQKLLDRFWWNLILGVYSNSYKVNFILIHVCPKQESSVFFTKLKPLFMNFIWSFTVRIEAAEPTKHWQLLSRLQVVTSQKMIILPFFLNLPDLTLKFLNFILFYFISEFYVIQQTAIISLNSINRVGFVAET